MSAQAGLFYFDLRPISSDLPRRLLESLREYGPDGHGAVTTPGLTMVYQAIHITPEDAEEEQPLRSTAGNIITWDGRIDNRDDLTMQLWREVGSRPSDAALALALYEKDGLNGLRNLVGDWSLAIWDEQMRAVILASDFAGSRALYYWHDSRVLHWSTSLGELLLRLGHDGSLDPDFVTGYITFATPPESTPYADIRAVHPGHALVWSSSGQKNKTRFWQPLPSTIQFRDERDYEVRIRELFANAVRGRLRSTRPVWAQLSGGLDSSTVCCMAEVCLKQGASPTPGLETISAVTVGSPESDESRFIAVVEEHLGRTGHRLAIEEAVDDVDSDHAWIRPDHPSAISLRFLNIVAQHGGRVMLGGNPGDLVMGNVPDYGISSHEIWEQSASDWLHYARQLSRASQEPIWSLIRMLWSSKSSARFIQRRLDHHLRRIGPGRTLSAQAVGKEKFLLKPEATRRWLSELTRRVRVGAAYEQPGKRMLVEELLAFAESRHFQTPSEFPSVLMYQVYMDRPLVEFVLAIPSRILFSPGVPRALMKRAFAPIVPARIIGRFSKGYAAPYMLRNLRSVASSLLMRLDRLVVVQMGLVDGNELRRRLLEAQRGSARNVGNLGQIAGLESWLERRAVRSWPTARISA